MTAQRKRDSNGRFASSKQKAYPGWQTLSGIGYGFYDAFHGQAEPSKHDLVKAYDDIVFAVARLISDKVADACIKLYVKTPTGTPLPKCETKNITGKARLLLREKRLGHNVDVKEVIQHPLLALLNKANAYHNYLDLIKLTQLYLDITGNAYWLLIFNSYGIPHEIVLLPSQQVTPERDERGMVRAWRFGGAIDEVCYSLDEIVHFKYPNLLDPYGEGRSPLRGAWQRVQVGWKELGYLDNTLSNMGRPDSIISIKESTNILEAERLAKDFKQRFSGSGAGGPMVVDGTMNFQPLSWPPKDLAELDLYKVVKTTICNCFGVPPDVLELGTSSNRSTREAAIYSLACDCIKPRVETLIEKLNERLVPYYDERLFFCAENIVPEDKEFELKERDFLARSQAVTRQELRDYYGFPYAEWATEPLLPSGVVPNEVSNEQPAAPEPQAEVSNEHEDTVTPDQSRGSQQIMAMQQALVAGTISREMAIANATIVFGFTPEEAGALFPAVPEKPPVAPPASSEPQAGPEAEPPAEEEVNDEGPQQVSEVQ